MGNWTVAADEIPDPATIQARLWVNDALRQDANTRDIIAAGAREGGGPVQRGDRVRITIGHIGEMTLDVQ